ncbi:MAG TPA: peptide chain release factor N(5)-glutamine methyltransferase, partial [bacterium]|nr:peptide chain release factor N(5)-glutamine methyltransferase [bacterium]
MTLQRTWQQGIKILRRAGTETPVLDAEVLLRHVTGFSREAFYRELMTPWTGKFQPEWMEILHRRAQGTPVAYLVGRKEFFGLELKVTEAVLV